MPCYFQPHCEEDIAVYFYQCVYQKESLQCQVPSREGLYELDVLTIKILKKQNNNIVKVTCPQEFALSWQGAYARSNIDLVN